MERINVTKTFLPPRSEYQDYLTRIWESGQITNQGPLLHEFEAKAKDYLGVDNFHFVANGTIALQLALRALDITEGEIITTPFSYVATTSSILWEKCEPVFVDIEPDTFCIDTKKIEVAITKKTKAIIAVHVFGYPCDVNRIEAIAKKHGLKVIYDAAHAFGVQYKGKSLLDYGDISTCSFHATKIFHTIEGGAVVVRDKSISDKVELIKRFGHTGGDHYMLGMNAKASELQAAMGLCNFKYIDEIIQKRKEISGIYSKLLKDKFQMPRLEEGVKYNYSYYPMVFETEKHLLEKVEKLNEEDIYPRRYFYPSLNMLPYLKKTQRCPVSEDISKRILCLPLYSDLEETIVKNICRIIST